MLKVMIVDDELIVRVGFQSCINWEDYGCQVAATCESGEETVAVFPRVMPDIVFTDIMMPAMNGIELVEFICSNYPKTKVVVLSCLNEIEYVKKAIKLGAEDYILKLSFTRETMVDLIGRLKTEIEKEDRETGNKAQEWSGMNREGDLRMLIAAGTEIGQKEALLNRLGLLEDPRIRYLCCCLLVDNQRTVSSGRDSEAYTQRYGLLNMVREYFGEIGRHELIFVEKDEIFALFLLERNGREEKNLEKILGILNYTAKTHLNLTLSMGIGYACENRLEIPKRYEEAKRAAALRFFDGPSSFHQYDGEAETMPAAKRSFRRKLQEAVFKQDTGEAFALIDQWFGEMALCKGFRQITAIRRLTVETWIFLSGYTLPETEEGSEFDDSSSTERFWTAVTLEELKTCFREEVQVLMEYLQSSKTANPEIMALLRYLEEHIDENISLEQAASRCALGKSQFCILFKKTTGETFINYFNGLKMKKAFEWLSGGNLQVQEAADRVGLKDISYFSRLFKKYYNMSPSDVKRL